LKNKGLKAVRLQEVRKYKASGLWKTSLVKSGREISQKEDQKEKRKKKRKKGKKELPKTEKQDKISVGTY